MIVYTKETTTDSTGDVVTFNETEVEEGSGLTKTKVALAELQALMTEENIGTFISGIPKNIEYQYTIPLTPITRVLLGDEFVIGATAYPILNLTVGVNTWSSILIASIGITNSLTFGLVIGLSPTGSETSIDISDLINDTNYDFYVYK